MALWDLYREAALALARHWPWFWPLVGGVVGGVLGSFLECAAHRLPKGLSLRQPPSYCPACKATLGVPDLVPVLSYLALGGRCRRCKASIGIKALVLEATCVSVGASLVWWVQNLLAA